MVHRPHADFRPGDRCLKWRTVLPALFAEKLVLTVLISRSALAELCDALPPRTSWLGSEGLRNAIGGHR